MSGVAEKKNTNPPQSLVQRLQKSSSKTTRKVVSKVVDVPAPISQPDLELQKRKEDYDPEKSGMDNVVNQNEDTQSSRLLHENEAFITRLKSSLSSIDKDTFINESHASSQSVSNNDPYQESKSSEYSQSSSHRASSSYTNAPVEKSEKKNIESVSSSLNSLKNNKNLFNSQEEDISEIDKRIQALQSYLDNARCDHLNIY